MQYKCETCHDSGSTNYSGEYLNCPDCDLPIVRRDLNAFVKSIGPTHPEDVALAIHQRALAMAPKQESPLESLPEMTDDRIFEWAEGYVFTLKGMPHKMTFSRPRFVAAVRTIIAHLPTPVAAPAAANGALTDDQINWHAKNIYGTAATAQEIEFAKAILAAAGHDAALPDFCFEDDTDFMHRLGLLMNTKWPEMRKDGLARKISELANAHIRAALSGAKGN